VKDVLQRLGLGRLAYHLYHRPKAAVGRCRREGGPVEQWRTAHGRAAMRRAAELLPPLPPPGADAPEICLLTGSDLWYQTAFFLHSLARFLPVRPVVHDDGTLSPGARDQLSRLAPFAQWVTPAETASRLDQWLPATRFPSLRRRRAELVLFRKLLDVHAGRTGWRMFCDSDMLVFRSPDALADWWRRPSSALHLTDTTRSYGYEMALLEELAQGPVPDRVNTGVLGLPSDRIDWEKMEYWCRQLIERAGTHYFQEQALVALLLSGLPHAALSAAEYVVLPPADEAEACRAVLHHYVAGSKRWYFRRNWRLALA
jgi:hypothetical protein